jgi:sec-independent protein translocase protein TatB
MSGIGGSEFILLCLIGLLILGPERLPRVARQIGGWLGKARQMTRAMQRQLEEELDTEKNFGIDPKDLDPRNDEENDVPAPAAPSEETSETKAQ